MYIFTFSVYIFYFVSCIALLLEIIKFKKMLGEYTFQEVLYYGSYQYILQL